MKKFYVYRITNTINHKVYIGKSVDPKSRFATHKYTAGSNSKSYKQLLLHKSIKKYGKENFSMEILGEYDSEELSFEYEKYFISTHKSNIINFGYNMTDGGEGASGWIMPEKTKLKLSQDRLGAQNPMFNRSASKITRQKLVESNKNRTKPKHSKETIEFYRQNIKNIDLSKRISNDTKSKIIDMYESYQYTKKQISTITGIKYHTVSWIIRRRDLPRYPNLVCAKVKEKVLELKNSGVSIKATATLLNIPIGRVENIRRKPRR